MTPERTCRTCVHCRPRYYTGRNWSHDRCALWNTTTIRAALLGNECSRQRRSWSPAPWYRRVALRLLTWLERLEAKL